MDLNGKQTGLYYEVEPFSAGLPFNATPAMPMGPSNERPSDTSFGKYIDEVSAYNKTIEGAVKRINAAISIAVPILGRLWDALKGGKDELAAVRTWDKMNRQLGVFMAQAKASGQFSFSADGKYDAKGIEAFANSVNGNMYFNYGSSTKIGAYTVNTPHVTPIEAAAFLNNKNDQYELPLPTGRNK